MSEIKVTVRCTEFKIGFDYQPFEPMERHYPGCPEDVEIHTIWIGGEEIDERILDEKIFNELHDAVLNKIKHDRDKEAITAAIDAAMY